MCVEPRHMVADLWVKCNLLLTSNLISHSLGLDDSNIIDDSLVGVEVLGQPIRI